MFLAHRDARLLVAGLLRLAHLARIDAFGDEMTGRVGFASGEREGCVWVGAQRQRLATPINRAVEASATRCAFDEEQQTKAATVCQTTAAVTEPGGFDRRVGCDEVSRRCSNSRFSHPLWASYCQSGCTNGKKLSNLQEFTETKSPRAPIL